MGELSEGEVVALIGALVRMRLPLSLGDLDERPTQVAGVIVSIALAPVVAAIRDEAVQRAKAGVLGEVLNERARQDAKWGQQNHADGTGAPWWHAADKARRICEGRFADGEGTWHDILREEYAEAMAEDDPSRLRAELVQVAAVAVAWVEAIDRRAALASATDGGAP